MNTQIAPWNPEEGNIKDWVENFELWFGLQKDLKDNQKVGAYHLTVGKGARSTLKLLPEASTCDEIRQKLLDELGDKDPQAIAERKLSTLQKHEQTCRELARQARTLAEEAFPGTPQAIRDRQALQAFLRSLPTKLRREMQ